MPPFTTSRDDGILIIGAGLAGLFLALKLAPLKCLVVSPTPLGEGAASAWAQGGLAAALGPEDAPHLHALDTIEAGAGLVDPVVADLIAREGPARVLDLIELGVPFDRSADGDLRLSLEAAHSRPRVARVKGDLAGKAIMEALVAAARAQDRIHLLEGAKLDALLQDDNGAISGALLQGPGGTALKVEARATILAVGGIGGLFRVTTNPAGAQGIGLATAYKAGAVIADAEFVQFHPTGIDIGRDPAPLATEALRGDGAILINTAGKAFMADYDTRRELAPRDIVARSVASEIGAGRGAFLDARVSIGAHFPEAFPTVFAACMSAGIDPRTAPIPIAPAAHYHMGGIVSDLWGQSSLPNLYVCGECASTGAHGANRLASNSLLEAVVFADRIARSLKDFQPVIPLAGTGAASPLLPARVLQELRALMASRVGVVRDGFGLNQALGQICDWQDEFGDTAPLIAARLVTEGAIARKESRGGHFRSDFPTESARAERSFRRDSVEMKLAVNA